jgi:hypothetical protein
MVYADVAGSVDEGRVAAWRALITANVLVLEKIERALAGAGLPPLGWYDVLLELSGAPGGRLRMHELARAVVLSRSGLTRLVDRLEGAGLLRREPDPADRRGSYAEITDEGGGRRCVGCGRSTPPASPNTSAGTSPTKRPA